MSSDDMLFRNGSIMSQRDAEGSSKIQASSLVSSWLIFEIYLNDPR